jgi:hypothetical protein
MVACPSIQDVDRSAPSPDPVQRLAARIWAARLGWRAVLSHLLFCGCSTSLQAAKRSAIALQVPRLLGALAVTNGIVRVPFERDMRKGPHHPHIKRIVQEDVRQERVLMTLPAASPPLRGMMVPSCICRGAFNQRSM